MSFGYVLKKFREKRRLSLRELGQLSGIDHVYIYRLEKDEKNAPSTQVINAFTRTLKLNKRQAEILRLLTGQIVDKRLIDVFINDEKQPLDLLEPLAKMSFRGKLPKTENDWCKKADLLKSFLEENE